MKKTIAFLLLIALFVLPIAAKGASNEQKIANEIGEQLYDLLKRPDNLKVTVNNRSIWVDVKGAEMDGVRVESVKIRAELKDKVSSYNKEKPAESIESSKGEIILLEKDVNDYFSKTAKVKGFSELNFDFSPKGFTAKGKYSAEFLLNLLVDISASGRLGIENDSVFLKDTLLYIQGISATESISQMIVNKINPLLTFEKIPFPITFNEIVMSDLSATMTAHPKPLLTGSTWSK